MAPTKTVLITGCSANGIGAALALSIAKRGHTVFATARNPARIPRELTDLSNVQVLALDVTSETSVRDAVKAVRNGDAAGRLDVLVNNAGAGYTMPLLDVDLDKAKMTYETNIWGCVRMTQAFADLLIESKGRVVMMSSMGAFIHTPWSSVYSSSKAALTNLSECLRLELAPFGVSVVTIMCGRTETPFYSDGTEFRLPPTSRYATIQDTIARWARGEMGLKGGSTDALAAVLIDDIVVSQASRLVWKGVAAGMMKVANTWMPVWLIDMLISQETGLSELKKSLQT